MTDEAAFDSLAELYDHFQDWARRLPKEIAWLDRRLKDAGVTTLVDAACGTGVHLMALAELGYEVAGADLSREMVRAAADRLPGIRVEEVGFDRLGERFRNMDAVLVLGNSLPNAGNHEDVARALAGLVAALRPGGLLVLHLLNFPKLVREGGGLKPIRRVVREGREYTFLKLFEVHPEKVVLDVISLAREEEDLRPTLTRSDLCPLTREWLERELKRLGVTTLAAHAGFGEEPFDEGASGDLVLLTRKDREEA